MTEVDIHDGSPSSSSDFVHKNSAKKMYLKLKRCIEIFVLLFLPLSQFEALQERQEGGIIDLSSTSSTLSSCRQIPRDASNRCALPALQWFLAESHSARARHALLFQSCLCCRACLEIRLGRICKDGRALLR